MARAIAPREGRGADDLRIVCQSQL